MFDPFEKRISRDIRNRLSENFLEALERRTWPELEKQAAALREQAPDSDHTGFIDHRMDRYNAVYRSSTGETPIDIARRLWDNQLFFECHEWVEELWLPAEGSAKKALQGIIRAAGAHVLAEAGRTPPAISSARKAMALINAHRDHIPAPFDPDELENKLKKLIEGQ